MKPLSIKRVLFILLCVAATCFIAESCSSGKKKYRVRSGSGMGNPKNKNRHVWGK
ncbi:MAG: hypothetical protein HUU48_05095 [Flavobacteriales bacterium]|nr:hypothetical protein [Flavobacteriales bacterium]